MRKMLVFRLLAFLVVALWLLSFLAVSIMLEPSFNSLITQDWSLVGWGSLFITVWYYLTVVVIGANVALAGFKLVGRWEKGEDKT